jgi:hypothetical protein
MPPPSNNKFEALDVPVPKDVCDIEPPMSSASGVTTPFGAPLTGKALNFALAQCVGAH